MYCKGRCCIHTYRLFTYYSTVHNYVYICSLNKEGIVNIQDIPGFIQDFSGFQTRFFAGGGGGGGGRENSVDPLKPS